MDDGVQRPQLGSNSACESFKYCSGNIFCEIPLEDRITTIIHVLYVKAGKLESGYEVKTELRVNYHMTGN